MARGRFLLEEKYEILIENKGRFESAVIWAESVLPSLPVGFL